ncbi:MAG: DmsE family decaheme c-type cytochrome [Planctomycetes bacterium]|nr:DmsE family decaheme c-type cytochrome [Planctomycetota bacterium]
MLAWGVLAIGLTGWVASCTSSGGAKEAAEPSAVWQAPAGANYVGRAACVECHEEDVKNFDHTLHAKKANPRSPAATHECESCHGPGSKHVDDGGSQGTILKFGDKSKASAATQAAQCLTCHTKTHPDWKQGKHAARDVSCVSCHSVHAAEGPKQLKKPTEAETCATCHKQVNSDLAKQSHHPIREGKIGCSDCHNPHGTPYDKNLRTPTNNETCYKCHTEKRGPFLWEHPVVMENCLNCHNPHGSLHDKLLIVQEPFVCQRCHSISRHPGTVYDATTLAHGVNASTRSMGNACLNCHPQFHGSNHPSGNFFER